MSIHVKKDKYQKKKGNMFMLYYIQKVSLQNKDVYFSHMLKVLRWEFEVDGAALTNSSETQLVAALPPVSHGSPHVVFQVLATAALKKRITAEVQSQESPLKQVKWNLLT